VQAAPHRVGEVGRLAPGLGHAGILHPGLDDTSQAVLGAADHLVDDRGNVGSRGKPSLIGAGSDDRRDVRVGDEDLARRMDSICI